MVWQILGAEDEAEVLVVLRMQADLAGADDLPTKEAKTRYVYNALRSVAEKTQADLRASLDAQGIDYQSFFILNAIRVQANTGRVRALASRSDVAWIVPNPWVRGVPTPDLQPSHAGPDVLPGALDCRSSPSIEPNLLRVNADDVWALGYSGEGIVVAGQDTGYEWDHPALKAQYRGWKGSVADHDYNWHDAIHSGGGDCGPDSAQPCDDHGHGTHTMGTILGDDGNGSQIGMAPGAEWIGCRNMDVGLGTPATYLECFEFFLAPYPVNGTPAEGDPALAPDVVNNSWSCPPSEGCDPGTLEAPVRALRQAGIVVVTSAGNAGSDCGSVSNPPALYRQSFSVGAFDHRTDQIASFSSRGPVAYAGQVYVKPDIAAPGRNVCSSVREGRYAFSSGTSMAAPHVAGAVALLLSATPENRGDVDKIELLLAGAAEPVLDGGCGDPGPPNNVWGWGILDVQTAVAAARSVTLQGTVSSAASGLPLAGASVLAEYAPEPAGALRPPSSSNDHTAPAYQSTFASARPALLAGPGFGLEVRTGPTGYYAMPLPAGAYNLTVEAAGYISETATGVLILSDHVATLDFALVPIVRLYLPLHFRP
jgi:subtilisin family serine protease